MVLAPSNKGFRPLNQEVERRLHIVRGTDLWLTPKLSEGMFEDRRVQFRERLGWPVDVDSFGYERDAYEQENPLYVIVADDNDSHLGSLRLLPTTGRTMILDHFPEATNGKAIRSPEIWECTRFCLSPDKSVKAGLALLTVTARLMQEAGLRHLVAVFDEKMSRLYRKLGVSPEVIGSFEYESGTVTAGLWSFDSERFEALKKASEVDTLELELVIANTEVPWKVKAFENS